MPELPVAFTWWTPERLPSRPEDFPSPIRWNEAPVIALPNGAGLHLLIETDRPPRGVVAFVEFDDDAPGRWVELTVRAVDLTANPRPDRRPPSRDYACVAAAPAGELTGRVVVHAVWDTGNVSDQERMWYLTVHPEEPSP